MRIGVTGHRWVGDPTDGLALALDRLLDEVEARAGGGGATCTLISALAEGADRSAARVALDRVWRGQALRPLPVD